MTQLEMHRPILAGLGEVTTLPEGFAIRRAKLADAEAVAGVLELAFEDSTWTSNRVRQELLENDGVDSCWVVVHAAQVVATASAQLSESHPDAGWLHWVGLHPDYAGRGLGRAVSQRVLLRHLELGKRWAGLTTDDFRLAAIQTYLRLGFVPAHTDETHPERWRAIFENLAAAK